MISNPDESKNYMSIRAGQGLSEEEKQIIKTLAIHVRVDYVQESAEPLASARITHKHKVENIMISNPVKMFNDTYMSHLCLNDDCAEMNDHITGQHIQGMVFTEAARQMMLAVAEKYILKDSEKENSYCALLNVNSQYVHFGFPIPTQIVHKIEELENIKPGRYKAITSTTFVQNEQIIAIVGISYLFNNKYTLSQKEIALAQSALQANRDLHVDKFELSLVG